MSTLLVANAGGHLQELHRLLPRLEGVDADVTWVTFDTAQARSLLDGEDVVYVDAPRPRNLVGTWRNVRVARRLLARRRFDVAVSTGSTVAVSFLPLARRRGASCHYIESATRLDGPSLTARVLRIVPGICLYSQTERWLHGPWLYRGSVFDGFVAGDAEVDGTDGGRPLRVVVTTGSTSYGFRSVIERMIGILPPGAEVVWQTGTTDVTGLPIEARAAIPAAELSARMAAADVVVAHAGVGSALVALEAGRWPVLVPRRRARGEHVDDHQAQIGADLAARGLALAREVDELTTGDLLAAARVRVRSEPVVAPFRLVQ